MLMDRNLPRFSFFFLFSLACLCWEGMEDEPGLDGLERGRD